MTLGLKSDGWVLVNSTRKPTEFDRLKKFKVATIDASGIAVKNRLGSKSHPIVNTAILGGFAKITGFVKLESVLESIGEEVPVYPEANVKASQEAFESVVY